MQKIIINPKTATDILLEVYPPRVEIIPQLIYGGCYVLSGPPKLGKSFLALQIAHHVSKGFEMWGSPIAQNNVLYFALEDDEERIQRRYGLISDYETNDHLFFETKAPLIINGFIEQVYNFAMDKNCKLIIVDTLQTIRGIRNTQFPYDDDCDVIGRLRSLADDLQACVLLIHHTRKMESNDPYDKMSGTNGIFGTVDGSLLLQKKNRIDNDAILICTGRDIMDGEYLLSFDRDKCIWHCQNIDRKPWVQPPDPFFEAINNLVIECNGHWDGTPTELSVRLKNRWPINKVTPRLNSGANKLFTLYNIQYVYKRQQQKRIYLDHIDDGLKTCGEKDDE